MYCVNEYRVSLVEMVKLECADGRRIVAPGGNSISEGLGCR